MAPYAFHPGWAAPRRSVHERLSYPAQGRLSNGVNRPMRGYSKKTNKQVWRAKSPSAEIPKPAKQKEESASAKIVVIGTEELKLKEPSNDNSAVLNNGIVAIPSSDVLAVPQGPMANDHEASTSKAKPRDPKYTQPKWCPPGLSKTQKRRLQRMRNHESWNKNLKREGMSGSMKHVP